MDSRRAEHQQSRVARTQQQHAQARDNRFSWQLPADTDSRHAQQFDPSRNGRAPVSLGHLTPQQIAAERVRAQEAQRAEQEAQRKGQIEGTQRFADSRAMLSSQQPYSQSPTSPIETPTAPTTLNAPHNFPSNMPWPLGSPVDTPTAPTTLLAPHSFGSRLPQSQTLPVESPVEPPTAPTTLIGPHSFSRSLASQQATPRCPDALTPPVSYAVLPQDAGAPLPAQTPPISVKTSIRSSLIDKQVPMSNGLSRDASGLELATAYVPYAEALHSPSGTLQSATTQSPWETKKSLPYAPADLVHVHQQAAVQQGRTAAFVHNGSGDVRKHQPGQIAHPNQNLRSGTGEEDSWTHPLFACTPDADTCCLGLVCPCIVHGRTAYRLNSRSNGQDPTDLLGFKTCNTQCSLMAILFCVDWLFPMITRTRVRHAYKIDGGVGGDCLTSFCCCCCVAVQNEREVKGREESRRRYAGPGSGDGYVPPNTEMRYQPGGS